MDLRQKGRVSKLLVPQEFLSSRPGRERQPPAGARQSPSGDRAARPDRHLQDSGEKLVFHRFDGVEGLSQMFEYRIEALSHEVDLDFTKLLGRNVCVTFTTYQNAERCFNGVLTEAEWIGAKEEKFLYRLVLRPWLWLLGRRSNSRIFKQKTIPEIIKLIFNEGGYPDYKIDVQHNFKPVEYIVQYHETDLAFICRLMEEYGIYYYFKHSHDKHEANLIDAPSMHPKISFQSPEQPRFTMNRDDPTYNQQREAALRKESGSALIFAQLTGRDRREQEHISNWRAERRFRTGRIELRDYDYLVARKKLKAEDQANEQYEKSKLEVYEYRGRWADTDDEGTHLAKVKLQAEQALDYRKFAAGDAGSLYPGGYFQFAGHPTEDEEYLVVSASHAFVSQEYRSGTTSDEEQVYQGQYEVQLNSHPFRAPQITPKARIYGPQTAFVVTREGVAKTEEIDVDKEGRIVVNFHWNRGAPDKDCSRAVRVAQLWAGKGWGWQMIPRVGMEVVVEFLDGDPDQPLVTGCVYNSDFPYPYTMPDKKTQSGVKTDSTIDNGNTGFNELRFEDKKGSEEVYFRAEKDHNGLIQNIETRTILNHQKVEIGKNFDGTDGGKHDGPSRYETIVNGSDMLLISNGDRVSELEKGNDDLTLDDGHKSTMLKKGDLSMTLKAGDWLTEVTGKVQVVATNSITFEIKGGACSIVMNPSGITLKGPMIRIN